MNAMAKLLPFLGAVIFAGCVTNSKVITDPAGMTVVVNGKDFGKSPCAIQSVGTTFGEYHLQLKDGSGKVVHEQNLPKNIRIWGMFWPPYGVFYNMFEFFPQYTARQVKTTSGDTAWSLFLQ
jgi:hypothetical protein